MSKIIIKSQEELEKYVHSPFFRLDQDKMACSHCNTYLITEESIDFLEKLNKFREEFVQSPLLTTNIYRCPTHNQAVSGAVQSAHVQCVGADIYSRTIDQLALFDLAVKSGLFNGIGIYLFDNETVHIDTKSRRRFWVGYRLRRGLPYTYYSFDNPLNAKKLFRELLIKGR